MSRILCIETSTHVCSVALSVGGICLDYKEIISDKYTHAEHLHPLIDSLETLHDHKPDAIAISKGPGSFTGLRIGVAAAKGFCLAWDIPLIEVDTLSTMFLSARKVYSEADYYIPMIDARRMEVYMRIFTSDLSNASPVESKIIDENYFVEFKGKNLAIFGDGAVKFENMLSNEHRLIPGIFPSAKYMIPFAQNAFELQKWEDLNGFEPYYLKDFIPGLAKPVQGL
jgi:tRNA threonylcarbamoyladenosine biosynthesis protein TsaB